VTSVLSESERERERVLKQSSLIMTTGHVETSETIMKCACLSKWDPMDKRVNGVEVFT
jgi:hypothetical protein